MDIFKMANEIAKNMSIDDKDNLDNMNMEEMISHVTKNVFGMMNNPNGPMSGMMAGMPSGMPPGMPAGMAGMMAGMAGMMPPTGNGNGNEKVTTLDTDSEDDEEDCIFAKTPDICFELNVDLEDFYTGKKKKFIFYITILVI